MALERNPESPIRWKRRIGIIALGVLGNTAMVWGFDFGLYPIIIEIYGPVYGGIIMTIASVIICLLTLLFYDWSGEDWLGIELIKELRDGNRPYSSWRAVRGLQKGMRYLLQKGNAVSFLALTIVFDPFITTAYMRRGVEKYRMTRRDWGIFFGSVLIGNLYWTLVVFGVLEAAERFLGL